MSSSDLLLRLNLCLLESSNVGEVLNQALKIILQDLGFEVACRWRADYDALVMHCIHAESADEPATEFIEFCSLSMAKKFAPGEGGPGRVWLSRRPLLIPDLSKEANFPRLLVAARSGLRSYGAFPLIFEKHVFGVYEFLTTHEAILDHDTLRTLETAGMMIGQFLFKQGLDDILASPPTKDTIATILYSDAIITIDTESKIILVNPEACRLFGYLKRELIGESLTILIPPDFRERHLNGFARYLSNGIQNITWNGVRLPALHKSGKIVPVEISFGELRIGDRRLFSGYVKPV